MYKFLQWQFADNDVFAIIMKASRIFLVKRHNCTSSKYMLVVNKMNKKLSLRHTAKTTHFDTVLEAEEIWRVQQRTYIFFIIWHVFHYNIGLSVFEFVATDLSNGKGAHWDGKPLPDL